MDTILGYGEEFGTFCLSSGCLIHADQFELIPLQSLSQRKQIQLSLLRFYGNIPLSQFNEVLSEHIINIVKDDTGIEYIIGDTILRELRQLRQDGKLDYECPNRKERIYKFKQLTK